MTHPRVTFLSLGFASWAAWSGCGDASAPPPGGGDHETPTGVQGSVQLVSGTLQFEGQVLAWSMASATFRRVPDAAVSCHEVTSGGCRLRLCAGLPPTSGETISAGPISIRGGTQDVTLSAGTDGGYPPFHDDANALWTGGNSLVLAAEGAQVPAFQATLTAPSSLTFTQPAPAPDAGAPLRVDRAQDFTLTWSGGSMGEVGTTVLGPWSETTVAAILCNFPAEDGVGVVPAALLGQLPMGAGTYGIAPRVSATPLDDDAARVVVTVSTLALSPKGSALGGTILLE